MFSEAVSGVDAGDFTLTRTGTASAVIDSVKAVAGSGGKTYEVSLKNVSGDGSLRLDVNASGTGILDAARNALAGGYATGTETRIDHTAPTLTSTADAVAAKAESATFTVRFSETVTGVDPADFTLTASGSAAGTISEVTGSGRDYVVKVAGISGTGSLRLALPADVDVLDAARNTLAVNGLVASTAHAVDRDAPAAPAVALRYDDGDLVTSRANLTVTPAEPGGVISYVVDGADPTASYDPTRLQPGKHTIAVTQTDAAGNASPTTVLSFTLRPPVAESGRLTAGDDVLEPSSNDTTVVGDAATLNPGDRLDGGAGLDALSLYGADAFDLTKLSQFAGFELVKMHGAGYDLTLTDDTLDVDASDAGAGTIRLGAGDSQITLGAGGGTLNLGSGHATVSGAVASNYYGGGGPFVLNAATGQADIDLANVGSGARFNLSSGAANLKLSNVSYSSFDLSSGAVSLDLTNAYANQFRLGSGEAHIALHSGVFNYSTLATFALSSGTYTIDLSDAAGDPASFTSASVGDIHAGDSLIGNKARSFYDFSLQPGRSSLSLSGTDGVYDLSGLSVSEVPNLQLGAGVQVSGLGLPASFKTVTGSGSLSYAGTSADLTGLSVSGGVTVVSTNADGTIFAVADAATALLVRGGAGRDTLDAHTLGLTAAQREAIFYNGSIEAIVDKTGRYSTIPVIGKVVDGYVAGATVFADANRNGVLDGDEASTKTDASGNYTLKGGSGPLVAFGGTDISTNLPLAFTLKAPDGATTITPLTTLVQSLGGTAAAASQVAAAFGLSAGLDLNAFDPVAAVKSGSADGKAAYLAGVAIVDTAALLSAALVGQGADPGKAQDAVIAQIAKSVGSLAQQGSPLDLTSKAVVGGVLADASSDLQIAVDTRVIEKVAEIVAVSNTTLISTTATGQGLLDHVASTASTAQGTASTSVKDAGSDATKLETVLVTVSAPSVVLTRDTGTSDTDGLTSDASLTVTPPPSGASLNYVVDDKPVSSYDPSQLSQGAHTVSVSLIKDGRSSAASSLSFVLDSVAPRVEGIVPATAGPTRAASLIENITFSEAVTGVDADDFIVTTTSGTATARVADVTGNGATYAVVLDRIAGNGTIRLDLKAAAKAITDAAGNAVSGGFFLGGSTIIDHAASVATLRVDGTADGVINAAEAGAVAFTVAGLDANAAATAIFTDGTRTVSASVPADGRGSVDLSGFNGRVGTTLEIADTRGNTATVAGNSVQLDTLVPAVPSLALLADTGTSSTDHITRDARITITPAEAGSRFAYSVDGAAFAAGYDPTALRDGTHTVAVTQTDAAGNTSPAGTLAFTLDTTAPKAALAGVSGQPDHETGHVFAGSLGAGDAGLSLTIRDGATVLGTATADSSGAFRFALSDTEDGPVHSHTLTATAIDAAGNTGVSDTFVFAFDYTPNRELFGTVAYDATSHVGQVYALYEGLLGRAPDQAGAQGWVAALDTGTSLSEVTRGFLDSPEERSHITAAGNSNAEYVEQLYATVLGRGSDAGGKQGWVDFLDRGASRVDVAGAFVFSQENLGQLKPAYDAGVYLADPTETAVARLYHGLLDRAPDAGGLANWTGYAKAGHTLSEVAGGFLASPEYGQLHPGGQTDKAFVEALYRDALGRPVEPAGEQGWLGALQAGASRAGVAVGIAESAEAQVHLAGKVDLGWHVV